MKIGDVVTLNQDDFDIIVEIGDDDGGPKGTLPPGTTPDPWYEEDKEHDDREDDNQDNDNNGDDNDNKGKGKKSKVNGKESKVNGKEKDKGDDDDLGGDNGVPPDGEDREKKGERRKGNPIVDTLTPVIGDTGIPGGMLPKQNDEFNKGLIPAMDGRFNNAGVGVTPEQVTKRAQETVRRAIAEQPGNEAGRMFRQWELTQRLDDPNMWKDILSNYIQMFAKIKYKTGWDEDRMGDAEGGVGVRSYRSRKKPIIKDPVFVLDTSGSISTEDLKVFCTHLVSILIDLDDVDFQDIHVLGCDADIDEKAIYHFEDQEDFRDLVNKGIKAAGQSTNKDTSVGLDLRGGGGTRFSPPFEWIRDVLYRDDKDVPFVVYFTDLASNDFPSKQLLYEIGVESNILWAIFFNEYSSKEDLVDNLEKSGGMGTIVRLAPNSLEK